MWIWIKILLKFALKCPINNVPALVRMNLQHGVFWLTFRSWAGFSWNIWKMPNSYEMHSTWVHCSLFYCGYVMSPSSSDPRASCRVREIAGCACAGKPLVSDLGMHHGTCVTHVPWCMSGSLTRGGRGNVPGTPGACPTLNYTYLARGPIP